MSDLELAGAVAVVTGAGSRDGIGFACARRLAALGARVVVTSTTERAHERARELEAGARGADADAGDAGAGRGADEAVGFVADLTDPAQADALVAHALERFGRLDVLVNNAGMTAVTDPEQPAELAATSDAQWRAALDRNLSTAFNVTRAALPALLASGRGRVVNVASTSGAVNAYPGDAGYHAAKAGMVGLTRALAVETAARGMTVNAVAPGWIATPSSTAHERAMGAATPAGRPGTADEIAAVVALLAAPAVSYLTGQLIVVDGANSIAEEKHVV